MKIKQILLAFLFTALVISCGKKAKDIDVSEITTACDVVDVMTIVADEAIALGEAIDSEEGASEAQKKELKFLGEISDEVGRHYKEIGLKESDLKDCPSMETLEKKLEMIVIENVFS
tara:strand:+ start:852 stop:1202 length:351 start_codon:yes stop_codon:yes gene_type:complete